MLESLVKYERVQMYLYFDKYKRCMPWRTNKGIQPGLLIENYCSFGYTSIAMQLMPFAI